MSTADLFIVASTDLPKKIAKRLKKLLWSYGYDIRLGECQNLVARMLGHPHFPALRDTVDPHAASLGDCHVDDATRARRLARQISVLVEGGIAPAHAKMAVLAIRPTDVRRHDAGHGDRD